MHQYFVIELIGFLCFSECISGASKFEWGQRVIGTDDWLDLKPLRRHRRLSIEKSAAFESRFKFELQSQADTPRQSNPIHMQVKVSTLNSSRWSGPSSTLLVSALMRSTRHE